jgi:hypothetical protein
MKHVNELIHETSPYLLQHAHNPVHWYPWGDVALARARQENKPILVSIGYAACHWCHVMEKESFEDESTAAIMNAHFICIKIDREERPDLDHFFMDALQAISGNGGWPLNMFLTADAKPFYGGTYFPPVRFQNRISWPELLHQIHEAYQVRRSEIEEQANNLTDYLKKANQVDPSKKESFSLPFEELFTKQQTEKMLEGIMKVADIQEGGFGRAPKFPQTQTIQYLLRYSWFRKNTDAFKQAELSLKKMIRGGIYDQIGGGFCRYSTDAEWLAPHFEKMTYDNALLISVMSEAFQITHDEEYKQAILETIEFMKREMMTPDKAFYSALDADSEGVEGKFYTWTQEEFYGCITENQVLLADYFDISEHGNWEHTNIPRQVHMISELASKFNIEPTKVKEIIQQAKATLLNARSNRIRPATDDKIILGLNALFNQALSKAATALSDPQLVALAEQNMDFIFNTFFDPSQAVWLHTFKSGEAKFPAFLDDLAYLCQALISLYEASADIQYLEKAKSILGYLLNHFDDEEGIYFYYTPDFQHDTLVRKKDLYDGSTPSGNAVMAFNLLRLSILLGNSSWKKRATYMLEIQKDTIVQYTNSYGLWANLLLEFTEGTKEVLILGEGAKQASFSLQQNYFPNRVLMASDVPHNLYPMMKDKQPHSTLMYYLCEDYTCRIPVMSDGHFIKMLTS